MHSFDDSQEHLEQLLAFPQVSIGDHCETMLLAYKHARGHVNANYGAGKLFAHEMSCCAFKPLHGNVCMIANCMTVDTGHEGLHDRACTMPGSS